MIQKNSWSRSFAVFVSLTVSLTMTAAYGLAATSTASGVDLDTFYDAFDDNSLNGSLWTLGSFGGSDPLVTVNETGGQLVITPGSNLAGLHYNGLVSNRTYDLTQETIFVEVVETTRGQSNTTFMFGADNNNGVIMETRNGSLYMKLVVNGSVIGSRSISYTSGAYRWWRISHVASGDSIRFETSPDGIKWTQRHSVPRGSLNISGGKVNLSAGTSNSISAPGRAVFDNLSWHPLVPNKGDWSAETTALSPNPSPGAWDHILWGAASPSTVVKFNGKYFLYYIGAEGDTGDPEYNPIRRSLGVATSSDGISFTKFGSTPIITYSTTGGSVIEEGVGGATAVVVGNTIHLYYGAIRSMGGQLVDIDIRYRKSTDGYNFTNDTLIYRSAGDEYLPVGVTYNGSVWSVYMRGPLTGGKGPLSRLNGSSPVNLPNKTNVTSIIFGAGGNANYIRSDVFIVHLDRREPTEDRFQVRAIHTGSPNALSEPLFSYTFGNFGHHATPATFKDNDIGKWFMYTLNLSIEPAVISVRTYTPSQLVIPTATRTPTAANTPSASPSPTVTRTPTAPPSTGNSTGWLSPGNQVPLASGDGNGFELNPTNAFSNDGVFATDMDSGTNISTTCGDSGKDRHKFNTYNITIPAGSTIRGIEVRLDAKTESAAGSPKMCVSLSGDNGSTWTSWKGTVVLTTSEAAYIVGGPTDLWGRAWTSTQLNNANLQLRVVNVAGDAARDFSLDWVAVNVAYSP